MSGRGTKAWYAVVMLTFVLSLGSAGYQILHPLAVQAWDPVFPQLLQNCFEAYSCEFEWAAGGDASCTYDGISQCCEWACEQNHAACSDACFGEPTCENACWTQFNDCLYGWDSCEYTALAVFVGNLQQDYIGACDWTTQPVPFGLASMNSYCQQP